MNYLLTITISDVLFYSFLNDFYFLYQVHFIRIKLKIRFNEIDVPAAGNMILTCASGMSTTAIVQIPVVFQLNMATY